MVKNYLKTAWRNILKHKSFSILHLLALTIAFAASILLYMAATYEFSFDNFHKNQKNIYQVYFESNTPNGKKLSESVPVPFAPTAQEELKGVQHISRYGDQPTVVRYKDKELSLTSRFVDRSFLDIFTFDITKGHKESALQQLNGTVLTEFSAKNIFGNEDPIGKQIELNIAGQWEPVLVEAVTQDFPNNSSIQFDALLRFEKFPEYHHNLNKWNNQNHLAFVLLEPNTSAKDFERQSHTFVDKYFDEDIRSLQRNGAKPDANGHFKNLRLLPLYKVHFHEVGAGGKTVSQTYPWILLSISLLILFIAASNFVNLSLGVSLSRGTEVGMRKSLGANKWQLFFQFWSEALILYIISFILACILVVLLLPTFNTLMRYSLEFSQNVTLRNTLLLLSIFVIVSAIAGGYPALLMTRFKTVDILKGKLKIGSTGLIRSSLTTTQFVITSILISATLIVINQIDFLLNKPLGYNSSEVISIPIGGNISAETAVQRMRNELSSLPFVESVTATDINMGRGYDGARSRSVLGFNYEDRTIYTELIRVDYDYLKTMQIDLLDGRDFSRSLSSDTLSVVVNEKMAAQLGGNNIVGQTFPFMDDMPLTVVGIVRNFNTQTLHSESAPVTMFINPRISSLNYIFVRIKGDRLHHGMQEIDKIWKSINTKGYVKPSFLAENTEKMYNNEKRFSKIIISGAVLAIFISCMGLIALTMLLVKKKTQEIGIRKVLGANVGQVILLMSKDFLQWIGIAFLISLPISWWLMDSWLQDFAYRISIHPFLLLSSGIIVMTIALLTVASFTVRAARANPVDSLRDE